MYNPISLNVIRQSLRWMGAPLPIKSQSSKAVIVSREGTTLNQITVTFDQDQLLRWAFTIDEGRSASNLGVMRDALRQCFCDDVRVAEIAGRPYATWVTVTLLCSLTARD